MAKASLHELLGKQGGDKGSLSLDDLPSILGDAMPELTPNSTGRFRLIRALQQRFGNNFRKLPGVKGLIEQFDDDIEHHELIGKLGKIKPRKKES